MYSSSIANKFSARHRAAQNKACLDFLASLAARDGHVTKLWPMGCEKKSCVQLPTVPREEEGLALLPIHPASYYLQCGSGAMSS